MDIQDEDDFSKMFGQDDFSQAFDLYNGKAKGGCDRDAPNGVPMLDHVLKDIQSAWNMVEQVLLYMPLYINHDDYGEKSRALLKLFFGINFTRDLKFNPNDDSSNAYAEVLGVFQKIQDMLDGRSRPLPRFKCMEDYAFYSEHLLGTDGKENLSAPLAGKDYNIKLSSGLYYPGLMFVVNPAPDNSRGWYPPNQDDPKGGACLFDASTGLGALAWTVGDKRKSAIYGITLCPLYFTIPTTQSLGTPREDAGILMIKHIEDYHQTGGIAVLHEFAHVVEDSIIDVEAVKPPNDDWNNQDWTQWTFDTSEFSYGYTATAYLGLAKPEQARLNADNYAVFALCLFFNQLDCLGTFQDRISKRQSVPSQLSRRTIDKVRLDFSAVE